jgi:hypothetical protein
LVSYFDNRGVTKHYDAKIMIFFGKAMNYRKFIRFYSYQRINKYFRAAGKNKQKAIELYQANLELAQAFHPLLGSFEVILRNQLHYVLAAHFNDKEWIIHEKTGFMQDRRLGPKFWLKGEVMKAEKKLTDKRIAITHGRIIAEQNLGFWNSLFEKKPYAVLSGTPMSVFKNKPVYIGRTDINNRIIEVREFRNRINHNEPICFVNGRKDFSYAKSMHDKILELMDWIDPDISNSLSMIDNVANIITKNP